jgi:hypothetical protein
MAQIAQGQVMPLSDAMRLEDHNGKAIKWKEQKDGTFTAKANIKSHKDDNGKELPGYRYDYILQPDPIVVTISVTETVKPFSAKDEDEEDEEKPVKATADEEKKSGGGKHSF